MKERILFCIITLPISYVWSMHLSEAQKTKEIIAFEHTVNQLFKQVHKEACNDPTIRSHNLIFTLDKITLANLQNSAEVKKSLQEFGEALIYDLESVCAYKEIQNSNHKPCEERQKLWNHFHKASRIFLIKQLRKYIPTLHIQNPISLKNILRSSRNVWGSERDVFFGCFLSIITTINLHLLHDPESYPRRDNGLQHMVQSFNKIDLAQTHTSKL